MNYDWLYREPPPEFYAGLNKFAWAGQDLNGTKFTGNLPGLSKEVQFPGVDPAGNPLIAAIDLTTKDRGLTKMAYALPSQVINKIAELEPLSDRVWVLGNAMGALESFGCFPAGTPIRMADGSLKPIEDVSLGESVLTHKGHRRSVEKLWSRTHQMGGVVRPKITSTLPGPWMTPNHPVFIIPRDDYIKARRRMVHKRDTSQVSYEDSTVGLCNFLREDAQYKVSAEELRPGDRLALPFETRVEEAEELVGESVARLLGYYLAEGCVSWRNPRGKGLLLKSTDHDRPYIAKTIFTLSTEGRDIQVSDELRALAKERGHSLVESPSSLTDRAKHLTLCDMKFSELAVKHLGSGAKEKFLSPEIKRMPKEWQLAFLGAYLNGDGCQEKSEGRYEGTLRSSTASRQLALDLQEVLWRLGIHSSVTECTQGPGGFGEGNTIYSNCLGSTQIEDLLAHTYFNLPSKDAFPGSSSALLDMQHGVAYLPVKSLEEDASWKGFVYNLQVEEEHSYIAGRLQVGNSNKNADAFPRLGLMNSNPDTYGHKTFEKHANIFTHHCFPPDTDVVTEDGSRVPISSLVQGDKVRTHRARPFSVKEVWERPYSGTLVGLKIQGVKKVLEATPNHPILVLPREQVGCVKMKGARNLCTPDALQRSSQCERLACTKEKVDYSPEFIPFSQVRKGDYVLTPVGPQAEDSQVTEEDVAQARIFGYFLAEGCYGSRDISGNPRSLQLTFASSEKHLVADVKRQALLKRVSCNGPYPHPQNGTWMVTLDSKGYTQEILKEFGDVKARGCRVPQVVFSWPRAKILHFLGAYLDGDGHQYEEGQKNQGRVRGRSVSSSLLYDLKDLALKVGIPCSVVWDGRARELPSKLYIRSDGSVALYKGYKTSESGCITFGARCSSLLAPYCHKVNKEVCSSRKSSGPFFWEGYLASPVREITSREYSGPVFNLKVEEDETYVAGEVAVHNCNKDPSKSIGKIAFAFWDDPMDKVLTLFYLLKDRAPHLISRLEEEGTFPVSMGCRCPYDVCSICLRKAPTRADYCDCLKYHPNAIFPDGKKAMAITPHPRFFDLSGVLKGADPIAYAMKIVDPGEQAKEAWERRPRYYPMSSRIPLLTKTASAEEPRGSSSKISTIKKRIEGLAQKIPVGDQEEDARAVEFAKESLPVLEAVEEPISDASLTQLANDVSLGEILATFTKLGMVLRPHEFEVLTRRHLSKWAEEIKPEEGDDKEKMEAAKKKVKPRPENVNETLLQKLSQFYLDRSCDPKALYYRSLAILGPLTKVSNLGGLPEGTQIIIVPPQKDDSILGKIRDVLGLSGESPEKGDFSQVLRSQGPSISRPNIPEGMRDQLMRHLLYRAYRTNLGDQDISAAFDKPVSLPKISEDLVASSVNVPTYTYLKYAYDSPWRPELPGAETGNKILVNNFLVRSLILNPLQDQEKLATVLELRSDNLVDAATILNLRFAGGAFRQALS